jgi:hypothetical protein
MFYRTANKRQGRFNFEGGTGKGDWVKNLQPLLRNFFVLGPGYNDSKKV